MNPYKNKETTHRPADDHCNEHAHRHPHRGHKHGQGHIRDQIHMRGQGRSNGHECGEGHKRGHDGLRGQGHMGGRMRGQDYMRDSDQMRGRGHDCGEGRERGHGHGPEPLNRKRNEIRNVQRILRVVEELAVEVSPEDLATTRRTLKKLAKITGATRRPDRHATASAESEAEAE